MEEPLSRSHLENSLEWVNGDDEKQRGYGVPLPKALSMLNWVAGNTIEDDPRGGGAKKGCDPVPKLAWESSPLEKIEQVLPLHGVEGLADVKLEEK